MQTEMAVRWRSFIVFFDYVEDGLYKVDCFLCEFTSTQRAEQAKRILYISMGITQLRVIILVAISSIQAKDPDLPLCPSNMQYFPQNLPMHCRMPATVQPFPPQLFPNPIQGKPGSFPVPLPVLPSAVSGMSGMGPIPGPMSMPMPMMPMPQAPAQKLPVIVMPFYSPDTSFKKNNPLPPPRLPHKKHRRQVKKRRPIRYDSSEEDSFSTDTSDESSDRGWWKKAREGRRSNRHHSPLRRKQQNRDLLTPVLQYVTKDGYVIFEKQISKGEAKDWLVKKNGEYDKKEQEENNNQEHDSNEERPLNNFNIMIRGDETVETKTEKNPQQIYKKKIMKHKPFKIVKKQE